MKGQETRSEFERLDPGIQHCDVRVDGKSVGLAISLGSRVLFYTTDERLQTLDGQRFNDLDDLHDTVTDTIRKAIVPEIAA